MTVLTTIPDGASYKDIRDTWNSMLTRLTALKDAVDPDNVFHLNQNIPPSNPPTGATPMESPSTGP